MKLIVADMEGVFLPEIWIKLAEKTGIDALKLTTRDISDYDVLMTRRLAILEENKLTLQDIEAVIATIDPLDGARQMLDWIRDRAQIIILSDTFEEFVRPLLVKLGRPTVFCHNLTIDSYGKIVQYNIRTDNQKSRAVAAFQSLNYEVIAFGDSYNDIGMIQTADHGFFFDPPSSVVTDFPDVPVTRNYAELKQMLGSILDA